eukprot:Awhi_evm1s10376
MFLSRVDHDDILESLSVNKLSLLNLDGRRIGEQGAFDLAQALEQNNTLVAIDLKINGIGDSGVVDGFYVLSEALKVNNTLMNLNLSQNLAENIGIPLSVV